MAVWAIADLHLSFGVPNKEMDVFGDKWCKHPDKITEHWNSLVAEDDLVLIPGDISWAMRLDQAMPDLEWINALPGTKVMIRGNHDYWWSSVKKMRAAMPESCHVIHNSVFNWGDYSIGGSRLWDNPEFNFADVIKVIPNPISKLPGPPSDQDREEWQKHQDNILRRELIKLENSLKQLDQSAKHRIVMTHYPPVGLNMAESDASRLLKQYNVDICVFGHLHNVHSEGELFGAMDGIRYIFVACDYTDFTPIRVR